MIWKLTEEVWWGDLNSPFERSETIKPKAIISLSHNPEAIIDKLNPMRLVEIPYLRFARHDDDVITDAFIKVIEAFVGSCEGPILVHCFAGQHRSPNIALFVALMKEGFTPENYERLHAARRALRSDIVWLKFGQSVDFLMRQKCGMPIPYYDRL